MLLKCWIMLFRFRNAVGSTAVRPIRPCLKVSLSHVEYFAVIKISQITSAHFSSLALNSNETSTLWLFYTKNCSVVSFTHHYPLWLCFSSLTYFYPTIHSTLPPLLNFSLILIMAMQIMHVYTSSRILAMQCPQNGYMLP